MVCQSTQTSARAQWLGDEADKFSLATKEQFAKQRGVNHWNSLQGIRQALCVFVRVLTTGAPFFWNQVFVQR